MRWDSRVLGSFFSNSYDDNQLQRYYHTSTIIDKQIFIYGGVVKGEGDPVTNSFVVYDLESGEHHALNDEIKILRKKKRNNLDSNKQKSNKEILASYNTSNSKYEVYEHAKLPALAQHTMNSVSKHTIYVYGGRNNHNEVSNVLYQFNIESLEWVRVKCESNFSKDPSLPHLYGHSAVTIDGTKLYVFGGTDGVNYFSDLIIIDTENNSWIREKTQGNKPAPRAGHSCVLYNNALYVFGGGNDQHLFNDLYRLDLDTFTWKLVRTEGSVESVKRINHSANVIANKMIVYGGIVNVNAHAHELMVLDLEHFRWDVESPHYEESCQIPPSLLGHSAQIFGSKIWILGGKCESDNCYEISSNIYTLETGIRGIDPIDFGRSTLTTDMQALIDCEEYADVILDYNGQFYHAHKSVLLVRCPIIHNECVKQSATNNDVININDSVDYILKKKKWKTEEVQNLKQKDEKVKHIGFYGFLEYVYTDRVGFLEGEEVGEGKIDLKLCVSELAFLAIIFALDRLFALCTKQMDASSYNSIPAPTLYSDMRKLYELTEKNNERYKHLHEQNNGHELELSPIPSTNKNSFQAPQISFNNGHESDDDDNYSVDSPMSVSTTTQGNVFSVALSNITTFAQNPDHSYCDVVFIVGVEREYVSAHSCILMSRSKFFHRMLGSKPQHQQVVNGIKVSEYELTGIRPEAFKLVLQFLYTGNVSVNFDISVELLIAAEVYQLERLSLICQSVIERKIHPRNVCRILNIADSYDIKHLRDTCTYFIVHHMSQVRKTYPYKKELSSELKHELKELRRYFRQQEGSNFYEQSEYALPFSSFYHDQYASYSNKQKKKQKNKQKKKGTNTPSSAPVPHSRKKTKLRKQTSMLELATDPHEEVSYLSEPPAILLGVSPPSPFITLEVAEYQTHSGGFFMSHYSSFTVNNHPITSNNNSLSPNRKITKKRKPKTNRKMTKDKQTKE
ncbi:hypothetical protein ABK040_002595 [Willaertia magna]